jgi:hypothetical protein
MQVDLRKTILYARCRNINVSGGLGLAIDDPIIILENHHGLALEAEKYIADQLIHFFRLDLASKGNTSMLKIQGAFIDDVLVSHSYEDEEGEEKTQETHFYFDITRAHQNIGKSLTDVKDEKELEALYDVSGMSPGSETYSHPHFKDAVALAITHGSSDLTASDLSHLYELNDQEATDMYSALDECGLLQPAIHECYQKYFGNIFPEGYWEIIW